MPASKRQKMSDDLTSEESAGHKQDTSSLANEEAATQQNSSEVTMRINLLGKLIIPPTDP